MPAKVFAFYSYKGGAGRTVAAANIASILTSELNRTVVLFDGDFESAGMGIVLGVNRQVSKKFDAKTQNRFALQDLLPSQVTFTGPEHFMREYWPNLAFDMSKIIGKKLAPNKFWFIPSRPSQEDDITVGHHQEQNLYDVQNYIDLEIQPDIIIFDSASGLTGPAVLSLTYAHSLVTFMRWSEQFVEGTINVLEWLFENRPIQEYFLVPSAVPETFGEKKFVDLLNRQQTRIDLELNAAIQDKSADLTILKGIPESRTLKWRETILCFEDNLNEEDKNVLNAYRSVAKAISASCNK